MPRVDPRVRRHERHDEVGGKKARIAPLKDAVPLSMKYMLFQRRKKRFLGVLVFSKRPAHAIGSPQSSSVAFICLFLEVGRCREEGMKGIRVPLALTAREAGRNVL
eukprot:scaffold41_cov274-Pinguiococcus_pyrenoidosus.AAC.2